MKKDSLILINTGDGKGKSTAAFGTLIRSLGHGKKCAVIQFIKSQNPTGESKFFHSIPNIDFHSMGKGFTWDSANLEVDKAAAREGLEKAKEYLNNPEYTTVLLDEITYTVHFKFLDIEEIISAIQQRSPLTNVIITGRDCPQELIEIADCVTVMHKEKHPFDNNIPARKGIDF